MTSAARPPARQPHHDGSPLYVPDGPAVLGGRTTVRLRVPDDLGPVSEAFSRSNPDHEPRFEPMDSVGSADGWQWFQGVVHVENPVHGYRFLLRLGDGRQLWLNAAGVHETEVPDVDDFRLVTYPEPPAWVRRTVLYQVFPDRFARSSAADGREVPDWAEPAAWTDPVTRLRPEVSTQFYGGDLDGIREHLDHLERLGVTVLYVTPVFPGRSNHRYDAASFDAVDPLLGGDEALIRLVTEAHARGLRVIGDLTSNHSGDGHEWFRAAYGNPDAPESAFYYWLDAGQWDYVSWMGVDSLPKFNWGAEELRRRFIEGDDSVVAKWLKEPYSLDGWRIDVSNMSGRYLADDMNLEVRRLIRRTMTDVNPDTMLLGESTNDAALDFTGDSWHGAMTYANLTRPLWSWLSEPGRVAEGGIGFPQNLVPTYDGRQFVDTHRRFAAPFPWRVRLGNMNAIETHDTARFREGARPGTHPVALGLTLTMPGIPVVWAGAEFGLGGLDGEDSRRPIPWGDAAAEPLIERYARMIRLRRDHDVLSDGGLRWLAAEPEAVVFVRESREESVLVAAFRSAARVDLPAGSLPGDSLAVPLCSESDAVGGHGGPASVALEIRADGSVVVDASGPVFAAWALPGVALPGAPQPRPPEARAAEAGA